MSRREIRIAGFGGQGVILAGAIIGKAASIFGNAFATLTQSYGPESRGGSCKAEVVVSDAPVDYPYVVSPQVQLIFSQEAYGQYGENAPAETLVIIDSDLVRLNGGRKNGPLSIPASRMAQEMGRPVVANIIMLGFLAAVTDVVSSEALKKAILDSIPSGTESFNMKAFEMGYNYGIEHNRKV